MTKIGLFYGSTPGKTADVAEKIQVALGEESVVTMIEISDVEPSDLLNI